MTAPLRHLDARAPRRARRPSRTAARFPQRLEARYQRLLLARLHEIQARALKAIEPVLAKRIARETRHFAEAREDAIRRDAPPPGADGGPRARIPFSPAELAAMIRVLVTVEGKVEEPAAPSLFGIARDVDVSATNEVVDQVRTVANINVFGMPGVKEQYQTWAEANVDLITSIDSTMFDQVRDVVTTALREGRQTEEVRRIIQGRFSVSESRARLIARDQIAKLNGDITKERQTSLGLEEYQWSTSGDERVRRRHERLDGTIQRWDKPPVVNERGDRKHPGFDFGCRCVSLAIVDDADKADLVRKSAERQASEARELMRSPITRGEVIPIKRRQISESRKAEFRGGYRSTGR